MDIIERPEPKAVAETPPSGDDAPANFSSTNPFACDTSRSTSPLAEDAEVSATAIVADIKAETAAAPAPRAATATLRPASVDWSAGPTILSGAKWKRQSEPFDIKVVKAESRG